MSVVASSAADVERDTERLIERIRASVIGDDTVLDGPFGRRRIVYADYTASGRSLEFIERFIHDEVLPLYANTHTETSASGLQTTRLREEARELIHRSVGGSSDDVVVFCGSGATGAVDKLVQVLGLGNRPRTAGGGPSDERPVVFVGPYEHHSNELPWRESVADVVTILENDEGLVDLRQLDEELRRYAHRPLRIGSFSAASNVTGLVTEVDRVSILLHRHGALACWDYASGAPYLPIEMNPSPDLPDGRLAYKDAVFVSPHKFVGGPGTPGVLVAKRRVFANPVPTVPGGGTVQFVSPDRQSYHPDPVVREEGGTPATVESIRAGLVFALKDEVGAEEIRRREHELARRAIESWRANPKLQILGDTRRERLAIVSFGIRHPPGLLHSNFVGAVLSDLFGIQARTGCFCAGPYIHRAYPIDDLWSRRMEAEVARGRLGAKLGFVRVGFNYFTSEEVFEYVVEAVHLLAHEGWKLLPLYRFDPRSGLWHHRSGVSRPRVTLEGLRFSPGGDTPSAVRATAPESVLAGYLDDARLIVRELDATPPGEPLPELELTPEFERIRWFPLAAEALPLALGRSRGAGLSRT